MAVRPILQLGNPDLHRISRPVSPSELPFVKTVVTDLRDTLLDFRQAHGAGRAIAAPQVGAFIRLVYMETDEAIMFINPLLEEMSEATQLLWDDCMSFPDLLVKVRRHRSCTIRYRDLEWREHRLALTGSRSELLQHEIDHLDGILATSQAVDEQSFAYRSEFEGPRVVS